jgi:hypothetical protein
VACYNQRDGSGGAATGDMGAINKLKRQVVSQLLSELDYILLVVDPRCAGVTLPAELVALGQPVGLHIGFHLAIPIPDLQVEESGISGTLSFNRTPFRCALPWTSVVQISAHDEHLLWLTPPPAEEPPAADSRPRLKLV